MNAYIKAQEAHDRKWPNGSPTFKSMAESALSLWPAILVSEPACTACRYEQHYQSDGRSNQGYNEEGRDGSNIDLGHFEGYFEMGSTWLRAIV